MHQQINVKGQFNIFCALNFCVSTVEMSTNKKCSHFHSFVRREIFFIANNVRSFAEYYFFVRSFARLFACSQKIDEKLNPNAIFRIFLNYRVNYRIFFMPCVVETHLQSRIHIQSQINQVFIFSVKNFRKSITVGYLKIESN